MGRPRVVVAGMAALAGVAAIAAGVQLSLHPSSSTLATDTTVIPDAKTPTSAPPRGKSVTASDDDLAVLAAPTSVASAPPTTPTTGPKLTVPTVARGFALVHVNNATSTPVRVFLDDADRHAKSLPAGEHVDWIVKTSTTSTDSGGARVDGTNCGGTWSNADNVVGGREYHFEIKPSTGFCAGGQAMPMVVLTDYTAGASTVVTGLVPDGQHGVVYVVNHYDAPVKVSLGDAHYQVEWRIDPGVWGATQRVAATSGVSVERSDGECVPATDPVPFAAGHTYRVGVGNGARCGSGFSPGLTVTDLSL